MSTDPAHTLEIAEQAMQRMRDLALPADPGQYELWYAYVSGTNENLNRRINEIIETKHCLSDEDLQSLQQEFLPRTRFSSAIANAGTTISGELSKIVGHLRDLLLSSGSRRDVCADASSRLTNAPVDHGAAGAVVDNVIQSLRTIESQQNALEKRLITSRAEIEAAHHALAKAKVDASLDALTGLANRRVFENAMERVSAHANQTGLPLSLLMIDIDNFKTFNNRFGHLLGDTVLRLISTVLKGCLKEHHLAARYGGEEFSVILPNTNLTGAIELAEQVRTKIMSRTLKRRSTGETLGTVTVSIGAATLRPGEQSHSIIERADGYLYEAKYAGRNCTRSE